MPPQTSFHQLKDVAVIKLHELSSQRKRLHDLYSKTLSDAESAGAPLEKLKILYNGVKSTHFAHKEGAAAVDNLENLISIIEQLNAGRKSPKRKPVSEHPDDQIVNGWIEKLKLEIDRGKKRADYAYLFGKTLEEWVASHQSGSKFDLPLNEEDFEEAEDLTKTVDRMKFIDSTLKDLATPVAPENYDLKFIDEVMSGKEEFLELIRNAILEYSKSGINSKATSAEILAAIDSICRDNLVDSNGKQQLRDISSNDMLLNEYAGIVTILLNDVTRWDWPAGSFHSLDADGNPESMIYRIDESAPKMRIRKNRSFKYRAFIDEDTITALFLQVIGVRWSVRFKQLLRAFIHKFQSNTFSNAETDFKALLEKSKKHAESSSHSNTESVSAQILSPLTQSTSNTKPLLFSNPKTYSYRYYSSIAQTRTTKLQNDLFCCSLPDTMELQSTSSAYGGGGVSSEGGSNKESTKKQKLLDLISAEVGVGMNGFPEEQTTVVSLDIEVLCYDEPSSATSIRRGILLAHSLSRLVSEMLLVLLEIDVFQKTRGAVQLMRVVDDIYFVHTEKLLIHKTWNILTEGLARIGLRPNLLKSGSVVIPGVSHPNYEELKENSNAPDIRAASPIPQNPVMWGLLHLRSSGKWDIYSPTVEKIKEGMIHDLIGKSVILEKEEPLEETKRSILTFVNIYNSYIRFFLKMFAANPISYVLGDEHLRIIGDCIAEIHDSVVGGESVIGYLEKIVRKRYLGESGIERIAEAWFYWPITAGGLAVINPLVTLSAFRKTLQEKSTTSVQIAGFKALGPLADTVSTSKPTTGRQSWDSEDDDDDEDDYSEEGAWDGTEAVKAKEDNPADRYYKVYITKDGGNEIVDVIWIPPKWQTAAGHTNWGTTYSTSMTTADPASPARTIYLEKLVEEFVNRGSDVRGTDSKKSRNKYKKVTVKEVDNWNRLGNYWKWVLCSYSQQVLDTFGSLGFTNAQLIPLALISEIRKESMME
ncbi:hypothetical protein HK098_000124 [Nowakowskiella sp. JEL0407]|nr:hypothetical protein HK098_000124 [Nowakowskiella sp. JEL0407]